jgi:hypothetical protein
MINIGIDFHDTISYNPEFFKGIMSKWNGKIFIITGTPISKRDETIEQLEEIGISRDMYHDILMGFEYVKEDMTINHFHKMKEHKLNHIKNNNISIYFDDNPFYVEFLRNYDVTVFQTILNDNYLDEFENKHKFFTCNLQRNQFDYLSQTKE